jgi:hypothetical protein
MPSPHAERYSDVELVRPTARGQRVGQIVQAARVVALELQPGDIEAGRLLYISSMSHFPSRFRIIRTE